MSTHNTAECPFKTSAIRTGEALKGITVADRKDAKNSETCPHCVHAVPSITWDNFEVEIDLGGELTDRLSTPCDRY